MVSVNERFSVEGQTVIITGSSQGIGRETAEQFAHQGADVVVTSRSQEKIDEVVDGIEDSDAPGRAIAVECDVRERDAVEALVETTVDEFGGLDSMVNNAGASFMAGFDDISENGWKTIVDINLHGTFHCSQVAGQHMRSETQGASASGDAASSGGTIINLASVAGTKGSPYMSHYGAAKAAVVNLTTTLAYEYADHGIRVNCIAPGFVATPGVASQMGVSAENIDRSEVKRRMGISEEISDIVQFLASDASSYMIGETVVAKGVPDIEENPEV